VEVYVGSFRLGSRDRVALVALGGVLLAAVVWTSYAYIDGVLLHGSSFWDSLFLPASHERWNRLVAVMGIFAGTLGVQIAYSRQLEATRRLAHEQSTVRSRKCGVRALRVSPPWSTSNRTGPDGGSVGSSIP